MLERFLLSYYFKLAKVPFFAWDIVKPVKLGDKSFQCPWALFIRERLVILWLWWRSSGLRPRLLL